MPGTQLVHTFAAPNEYLPGGHFGQISYGGEEYVPAPHSKHTLAPVFGMYLPDVHELQKVDRPKLGLYVPSAHGKHSLAPEFSMYLPGGQDEHRGEPDVPAYLPGIHWLHTETPIFDVVPIAQLLQTDEPEVFWYLPFGHKRHSVNPAVGPYLPEAGHFTHDAPSVGL